MSKSISGGNASKRSNLNKGIKKIYESKEFCDATIIVGSKKFNVHRLVLASRCSEFARVLFEGNAIKDVIVEDDAVTETGFEILLRFIYTDTLGTDDKSSIIQAYLAADYYKLKILKKTCSDLIETWNLTTDEVCELLNVSLDIPEVKQKCLNLIKRNPIEVMSSPSFLKLSYDAMVAILDNDALQNVENKKRIEKVVEWGANKKNISEDYDSVRAYFLSKEPPLFAKLKIQELNLTEMTDIFTNTYKGLLTHEEFFNFIQYTYTKNKHILPSWCIIP